MDKATQRRWEQFGKYLRRCREAMPDPENQVASTARRANMSRPQYIRLENGESGTKRERIPLLAKAVRADEQTLYELAGFSKPGVAEAQEDPRRAELINLCMHLPPEHISPALVIINGLFSGHIMDANSPSFGGRVVVTDNPSKNKRSA